MPLVNLLNSQGKLKEIIIINEGRGYSTDVEAKIVGGYLMNLTLQTLKRTKVKLQK